MQEVQGAVDTLEDERRRELAQQRLDARGRVSLPARVEDPEVHLAQHRSAARVAQGLPEAADDLEVWMTVLQLLPPDSPRRSLAVSAVERLQAEQS